MSTLEEQIAHLPDLSWGLENLPKVLLPFEIGVMGFAKTSIIAFVLGKSSVADKNYVVYSSRIMNNSDKVPRDDVLYLDTKIITNYQGTGLNFNNLNKK